MQKPKIIIADDHPLVLEGLRSILQEEFDIIGTADNGRDLVAQVIRLRPDAALFDIGMPGLNGLDAARQIREANQSIRLVAITQRTEREYVHAAFQNGINGYVSKQAVVREIIPAMRLVMRGRYYVGPHITKGIPDALLNPERNPGELFSGALTTRQREVLQLVAEGKTNKQIAAILGISAKTVDFHRAAVMDQLGLRTTAELTRYAIEHGMAGV